MRWTNIALFTEIDCTGFELGDGGVKGDRAIASFCGVSTPTVSKQRKHLQEEGLLPEISERTDKSGRKLKTGNIGTKANHKEKILKIARELEADEIEEIIGLLEAML
jgi:DNA-binding Lrp family transcriptional regulator